MNQVIFNTLKMVTTVVLIFVYSSISAQDTFRLFYLGGQSNMNGFGKVEELPDSLNRSFDNVWIFQGNSVADGDTTGGLGIWEKLRPGHGNKFKSDGVTNRLSKKFGVELSFASRLQQLFPDEKIAIVKYARSGSSIDSLGARQFGCWDPDFQGKNGINQYDHFLKTVRTALNITDINGDGQPDQLVPSGILWMQGESDGRLEVTANHYHANLKRLIDLIRATMRVDDLPVVIGKISDSGANEVGKIWAYGEVVQAAQEKLASEDKKVSIVRSTSKYNYSDKWHYDSEGYIDLGIQFANELAAFRQ